jgi:KDO2-lipid IV(A) lauroyltransferase
MNDLIARVLYALAALLARLPWKWLLRLGDAVAMRSLRRDSREIRVTRRNLELAFPDLLPGERDQLQREVIHTTARQALETLRLWTRPHAENLALIREMHGVEHFDAAIAAGRGVIIAAPHYGNWELLNQWLASRTPLAILYKAPDSAIGEAFLNRVRAAHADPEAPERVIQVRADSTAVRQLWRLLKGGGVVGILPDQQPKVGDGEFAPFFGVQALTMTLLGRLAERTGAAVLLAWCERIDSHGDTGPAFALHIEPAPAEVADADPASGVHALNAAIERIVRRAPAQYQWTYKRYSLRPPVAGDDNPYWPDCY